MILLSSPASKNNSLGVWMEAVIERGDPASIRGTYRDRHERWVWDAMDAAVSARGSAVRTSDDVADGEVVWS
jgi:hypothetical protein